MRNRFLALVAAAVISGCSSGAPAEPEKPKTTPVAKPAEAPRTPAPAAVLDRTQIKADVSKVKFLAESELFGYDDGESRAFFYTNGTAELTLKVPADGEYDVIVTASCTAANGQNAKFKLKVDGVQVGPETQLKSEDAKDYTFATALKAGERKIATEFTNDLYKEGEYDLNFFLNGVKLIRTR